MDVKGTFAVVFCFDQQADPPWGSNRVRPFPMTDFNLSLAGGKIQEGTVGQVKFRGVFHRVLVQEIHEDTTLVRLICKLYNEFSVKREKRGWRQAESLGLTTPAKATSEDDTRLGLSEAMSNTEMVAPTADVAANVNGISEKQYLDACQVIAAFVNKRGPGASFMANKDLESVVQPLLSSVTENTPPACTTTAMSSPDDDEVQIKSEPANLFSCCPAGKNSPSSILNFPFPRDMASSLDLLQAAREAIDRISLFIQPLQQENVRLHEECRLLQTEQSERRSSDNAAIASLRLEVADLEKRTREENKISAENKAVWAAMFQNMGVEYEKMKATLQAALDEKVKASQAAEIGFRKTETSLRSQLKTAHDILSEMQKLTSNVILPSDSPPREGPPIAARRWPSPPRPNHSQRHTLVSSLASSRPNSRREYDVTTTSTGRYDRREGEINKPGGTTRRRSRSPARRSSSIGNRRQDSSPPRKRINPERRPEPQLNRLKPPPI